MGLACREDGEFFCVMLLVYRTPPTQTRLSIGGGVNAAAHPFFSAVLSPATTTPLEKLAAGLVQYRRGRLDSSLNGGGRVPIFVLTLPPLEAEPLIETGGGA